MFYQLYEMQRAGLAAVGAMAQSSAEMLGLAANPFGPSPITGSMQAALGVFAHASAVYHKPEFGITQTLVGTDVIPVREEIVAERPFGNLLRFVREGVETGPKLLIVAPMSGHFATLLRETVDRMLPGHDVHITDWSNARDVPPGEGRFGLDDYIDYVIDFIHQLGPDSHVIAVCQPAVPVYAALCLMAQRKDPLMPRSLTIMGGPIDTRNSPTAVNLAATGRPYGWYEQSVIHTVSPPYAGAGRSVYPGFLQLTAFLSMNLGNHLQSHWVLYKDLRDGKLTDAAASEKFYAEYRAVADMTAEFYLETIDRVFQRHLLPKGELPYRGTLIDPGALTSLAILAIEGERDDICGLGQSRAALDIAVNLPDRLKHYHLAEGAGHYGVFAGTRWRTQIAPVVEDWIAAHSG
ncbi:MAG: polyhydroxyalkanoate depolymerase [Pseudomonadota bacterium]